MNFDSFSAFAFTMHSKFLFAIFATLCHVACDAVPNVADILMDDMDDIDDIIERELASLETDLENILTFRHFHILEGASGDDTSDDTIGIIEREIADLEDILDSVGDIPDPMDFMDITEELAAGSETNTEVDIYVIDSGIDFTHPEFFGVPTERGIDFVGHEIVADGRGHGTSVASMIAGANVGIAKNAKLIDVRVLDREGHTTVHALLGAFYWIAKRHVSMSAVHAKPAIINVSLSGPQNHILEQVIEKMLAMGIHIVAAAGNKGEDACNFSPGNVPGVITVANADESKTRHYTSNYGTCVMTYAHGQCVYVAIPDGGYKRRCGTSMAAGVTTGVLAQYLSRDPVNGDVYFYGNLSMGVVRNNVGLTPNKYVVANMFV